MPVPARQRFLVEICLHGRPVLDGLAALPLFSPSGDRSTQVFVPNNRVLAFVMIMGQREVGIDDTAAVLALREECRTTRRAALNNRGAAIGDFLDRDASGTTAGSTTALGPRYLTELAAGLGCTAQQRDRLAQLNALAGKEKPSPIDPATIAREVLKQLPGTFGTTSSRNLADDPPQSGATVDRSTLRERCERHLAAEHRRTRPRPLVLCGPSGTGKTALVLRLIDQLGVHDRAPEIGVWIHASSRTAVLDGFARAAAEIRLANQNVRQQHRRDPLASSNPLVVANHVCDLLSASDRPWYVVLDDVTDPAEVAELSLPGGSAGQTMITSRRSLSGWPSSFATVGVGPYSAAEAEELIRLRLTPGVRSALLPPNCLEASAELAAALDYQPFSLDQAAVTILRESLSCAEYLQRLRRRSAHTRGVPYDERDAAANWLEGLARTSYRPPPGMEERFVVLAAVCGPTVPVALFMTAPGCAYLGGDQQITPDDARRAAVRLSTRGLLAFGYSQLADPAPYLESGTVRMHDIAKRAVLATYAASVSEAAHVAAGALRRLWGDVERNPVRNAQLRSCAQSLVENAPETVWHDAGVKGHVSEFIVRSLNSLGESGQTALAADGYTELVEEAVQRFGATHPATLELRGRAALWRGRAGDVTLSVELLEHVVADYAQLDLARTDIARTDTGYAGPEPSPGAPADLRSALLFRQELAVNRGWAGHPELAIADFDEIIASWLRTGQATDGEDVLRARYGRALWLGRAGDPRAALAELTDLLPLRLRHLEPDRLGILRTRLQCEIWRSRVGSAEEDPALRDEAVANLSTLVTDWVRVAGRDHPDTLRARRHLAVLRGLSGDRFAIRDLEEVLDASRTLYGPQHPDTLRSTKELALAHGRLGDWARALDLLGALTKSSADKPPTPESLRVRYDLAHALVRLGRRQDAVRELEQVRTAQRRLLSPGHPDLADTDRALHDLRARLDPRAVSGESRPDDPR